MSKRNTYRSCGEPQLRAKQEDDETPEEQWKKRITLEKKCGFKDLKQEDQIISKFINSIIDEKLQESPEHQNNRGTYYQEQLRPTTQAVFHTPRNFNPNEPSDALKQPTFFSKF